MRAGYFVDFDTFGGDLPPTQIRIGGDRIVMFAGANQRHPTGIRTDGCSNMALRFARKTSNIRCP